jgi:FkbM family methyltransferase
MHPPLKQLFINESVEDVLKREQHALEDLLNQRHRQVVLFGAGTLGRRALPLLSSLNSAVLAFTDNNPASWGTQIEGITVISPKEAASLFGQSALFIVTIWNDRHWFSETHAQLRSLGCTLISTYAPLYWRFPDSFLQLLFLNEPPHRVYEDSDAVLRAEQIWADSLSQQIFQANILWRALGEALEMPGRPEMSTYFPRDIFSLNESDLLLDCGAFDGDTIRQALETAQCPMDVYAIEADAISYARLHAFADQIRREIRNRIHLYPCAVGRKRGLVYFDPTESLISKASNQGTAVEVFPIDELFADTRLTFIKMDIEGAEYEALQGAAKVIQRDRPILAICVYHTQRDIWRIPLLVRDMAPDYKFFLRAYEGDGFQTVMYAVPPDRVLVNE